MGKKSVKENKNAYQLARESCNYTRDQASELMDTVSSDLYEKTEANKKLSEKVDFDWNSYVVFG